MASQPKLSITTTFPLADDIIDLLDSEDSLSSLNLTDSQEGFTKMASHNPTECLKLVYNVDNWWVFLLLNIY